MASSSSTASLVPRAHAATDAADPKPPQLNAADQFRADHPEAGQQLLAGTRVYARYKDGLYYAAFVSSTRPKANQRYDVLFTDDVTAVVARKDIFLLSEVALAATATIWTMDTAPEVDITAAPSKHSAEDWLAASFTVVNAGTTEPLNDTFTKPWSELCFGENLAPSKATGQGAGPRARRTAKRFTPVPDDEDDTEKIAKAKVSVKNERKRRLEEENEADRAGPSAAVRKEARSAKPSAQRPEGQQPNAQLADAQLPVEPPTEAKAAHGETHVLRETVETDVLHEPIAQMQGETSAARTPKAEQRDALLQDANVRMAPPTIQRPEEHQYEDQQQDVKVRGGQRVAQPGPAQAEDDNDELRILQHVPPKRRRTNAEAAPNRVDPDVTDYGPVLTQGSNDHVFYRSSLVTGHLFKFGPVTGVMGARRMYTCIKCREVEPTPPPVIVENGHFVARDPDCPQNRPHACLTAGVRKNGVRP